jgi:hypothetical protein
MHGSVIKGHFNFYILKFNVVYISQWPVQESLKLNQYPVDSAIWCKTGQGFGGKG